MLPQITSRATTELQRYTVESGMRGNNDDHGPINPATPILGVSDVLHDVNRLTATQWGMNPTFRIECSATEGTR
jgi:hypothetical protein